MDHQNGLPSACGTSQQPILNMVVQLIGAHFLFKQGVREIFSSQPHNRDPGCEQIHGRDSVFLIFLPACHHLND